MRATGVAIERVVVTTDALEDALDRLGDSAGVRKGGVVLIGEALGDGVLTSGPGGVTERSRRAGEGEGGGVRRLRVAGIDTIEVKGGLAVLEIGRGSTSKLVSVNGCVRRGSG